MLLTPPSQPHLLDNVDSSTAEFIDDNSDSESDFSGEDDYDNELFMNQAKLSTDEAKKLFYNPMGPWSSVVNCDETIKHPVIVAKLHGELAHPLIGTISYF